VLVPFVGHRGDGNDGVFERRRGLHTDVREWVPEPAEDDPVAETAEQHLADPPRQQEDDDGHAPRRGEPGDHGHGNNDMPGSHDHARITVPAVRDCPP